MPNGPGVNEREFWTALSRELGPQVTAVIPRPRYSLPESELERSVMYSSVPRWGRVGQFRGQIDLVQKVSKVLREESIDLVVARIGLMPLGFRYLMGRFETPFAIKTLGDVRFLRRYTGLKGLLGSVLAPLHESITGAVVSRAIALDACTPELVDAHMRDFSVESAAIRLIPNATNIQRFCLRDRDQARTRLGVDHLDPILGFVGGDPVARGGPQVIRTAARLSGEYPRIGMVIVGGGIGPLRQLATRLGVGDRCVLPGVVPYDQVPDYISTFDVGFGLESSATRLGAVGNSFQKIRQYVASGVPVIGSLAGSEFLVGASLGSGVDDQDDDAIDNATRHWLAMADEGRPEFRRRASDYARRHLSTERTLHDRMEFWSTRLMKLQPRERPQPQEN